MPTTRTARMKQIAADLRSDGAYTSANSVEAITAERDALLVMLALPQGKPAYDYISKCPQCGGEADNGNDRCIPPSAYLCSKCCGPEAA